jgi:hypothetical protein
MNKQNLSFKGYQDQILGQIKQRKAVTYKKEDSYSSTDSELLTSVESEEETKVITLLSGILKKTSTMKASN